MESLAETLMTPSTTQNDLAFAGSDWSRKARVAPRNVITAFTGEKVAPVCPQIERNRYSIVCHDRPLKTVTMLYHPFIVNGRTVDIINRSLKKKKKKIRDSFHIQTAEFRVLSSPR